MNLRNVAIVYRKELTEWLRDKRTLISTVLVPLLAFPILMVGMTSLMTVMIGKAEKETAKVMVIGGEDSPKVMQSLKTLATVNIIPPAADFTNRINEKLIRAAVAIPAGFDRALEQGASANVPIYFYEGEMKSRMAADRRLTLRANPGALRRALRPCGAPSVCSPSARGLRGGTRRAGPHPQGPGTSSSRGRRARGTAPAPPRRARRRRS